MRGLSTRSHSRPFLISATEITHTQYIKVMGTSPARSAQMAARRRTDRWSG